MYIVDVGRYNPAVHPTRRTEQRAFARLLARSHTHIWTTPAPRYCDPDATVRRLHSWLTRSLARSDRSTRARAVASGAICGGCRCRSPAARCRRCSRTRPPRPLPRAPTPPRAPRRLRARATAADTATRPRPSMPSRFGRTSPRHRARCCSRSRRRRCSAPSIEPRPRSSCRSRSCASRRWQPTVLLVLPRSFDCSID